MKVLTFDKCSSHWQEYRKTCDLCHDRQTKFAVHISGDIDTYEVTWWAVCEDCLPLAMLQSSA